MLHRCSYFALLFSLLGSLTIVQLAQAAKFGDRTLQLGMHGTDVRRLQSFLNELGYDLRSSGRFDLSTSRQVKRWQRASAIKPTGVVTSQLAFAIRDAVTQRPPGALSAVTGGTAFLPPPQKATLTGKIVVAPEQAPPQVKAIIDAANKINDLPYRYGGGHGKVDDTAYDCSGSVSYALVKAGMLEQPLDSSQFMAWGLEGAGQWVTVYTNPRHAFMVVAGLLFDTSGRTQRGTRWGEVNPDG